MLRRLVAALSLVAFLAYGAWSETSPCAMHDGVLAQMVAGSHDAMAASHHGMPDHDGAPHHCTCMGDCGVAIATALPSPHLGWVVETARPAAVTPAVIAHVAIARAHARPWSTAPPAATRIA